MNKFEVNLYNDLNFDYDLYKNRGYDALDKVLNKTGIGSEYLGWLTLPETYDREEYERMKELSEKVKKSEVLLVVGVGGSFLGAKAIIDSLKSYYDDFGIKIIFVGNNLSGNYLNDVISYIKDKDFYINVISKSGSTFETAVSFRILKNFCKEKYKKEYAERIIVTTDDENSILKDLSDLEGYNRFVIPFDIGGRFSVLTAVGLFPIMCADIDTDALLLGANDGMEEFLVRNDDNVALKYAIYRNHLMEVGKKIEYLVVNEPKLEFVQEWWKQLFSESEGKDGKGLYTSSAIFTRDLHSFGQMIQEGKRIIFETVIEFDKIKNDFNIVEDSLDYDNLNYLSDKSLNKINNLTLKATINAHRDGNVPIIKLKVPSLDTYNIGKLIYFFEVSCAISAYMLGVNPFDQPGVENYKKNMYSLLKEI